MKRIAEVAKDSKKMRKIRKMAFPIMLCILIVLNLTILPNAFNRDRFIVNEPQISSSSSTQTPSIPLEPNQPNSNVIPVPPVTIDNKEKEEKENETKETKDNKNDDSNKIPPLSENVNIKEPAKQSKAIDKRKFGANVTVHSQSGGFRFYCFFLFLFIVGLMYITAVMKTEADENHDNKKGKKDNNTQQSGPESEGYIQLGNRLGEYYDKI